MFSTESVASRTRAMGLSLGAVVLMAAPSSGQVPGSPVLQNAFANPGLAIAANFAGGGGQSFFGAATGYGLGSGRLQASGAAGVQRANGSSRGAYGGRVSANVWTSSGGSLGAGAFAGLGGAPRTRDAAGVTNAAVMIVPVGITVGYRRAMGAKRGISAYASPLYRWTRAQTDAIKTSSGGLGGAVGVDFAVSQSFGATVGAEFGKSGGGSGRTSSTIGAAISFVPGR